jgi:hypothetical protein
VQGEDEINTRKQIILKILKEETAWDLDVSSRVIIKQILNIGRE